MKKISIQLLTILFLFSFNLSNSIADNTYFIDITKVLNKSKAGAQAQNDLKKKIENQNTKFKKEEDALRKQETDIISQKTIITKEEYKKKVEELRKKVSNLQKEKQDSFNSIAKSRNKAKAALLKAVKPILKKYMEDNNIRIIVSKQSVILGDTALEITNQIIDILNRDLKSLKVN